MTFCVHYILANVVSKIHITKIGITKINAWGVLFRLIRMRMMMMMLFAKLKYAKNANKLLK